ncbi:MAG: hypothetical protein GY915_08100 [bacterium]|nr:hypothetical protein [bacterium]
MSKTFLMLTAAGILSISSSCVHASDNEKEEEAYQNFVKRVKEKASYQDFVIRFNNAFKAGDIATLEKFQDMMTKGNAYLQKGTNNINDLGGEFRKYNTGNWKSLLEDSEKNKKSSE